MTKSSWMKAWLIEALLVMAEDEATVAATAVVDDMVLWSDLLRFEHKMAVCKYNNKDSGQKRRYRVSGLLF